MANDSVPKPTLYRWSEPPADLCPVVGIDAGGTFTDFVALDARGLSMLKLPSHPDAPERAVLAGLGALGFTGDAERSIVHGSTVATNALLERKGAETMLVTNAGFEDLLELGRQARPRLYDLTPPSETPLTARRALGLECRRAADGSEVTALTGTALEALVTELTRAAPEAVAVSLLFSYLAPDDEARVVARLRRALPDAFICASHEVVPEQREYERGMTTWVNAYLGPLVAGYLGRLAAGLATTRVSIMQSAAVTVDLAEAARTPVRMLLSGPAGGMIAARALAERGAGERLLTFDMGGTSTDVGLIDRGFTVTSDSVLEGVPLAVPAVDMHTIGAGGGSIVYLDAAGGLQVGPESAGAVPGPVSYRRGGTTPTVTDANLVLGRIPPGASLGGIRLELAPARAAFSELASALGLETPEAAADAAIELVNARMVSALRVMSMQRGIDPAELTLVGFGGAGGLHVTALADELGVARALVPVHAGTLSALGMVLAPPGRELSRSVLAPLGQNAQGTIDGHAEKLMDTAREALIASGAPGPFGTEVRIEVRYVGQAATIAVPWRGDAAAAAADFDRLHEARFGHRFDRPREASRVRVRVTAAPHFEGALPRLRASAAAAGVGAGLLERSALAPGEAVAGPVTVSDPVGTTYVDHGWTVRRDESGNLWLGRADG